MRTRSAAVDLTWNGAAVKSKMLGQTTEITYTDPASGEADSHFKKVLSPRWRSPA